MKKFKSYQRVRIVNPTSKYYQRVGTVWQIYSYGYSVLFHPWLGIAPTNKKGQVQPVFFRKTELELG